MENLQIEAGYVLKLLVLCGSGVAYYFYLNKSIGILNERQKMNKRSIECLDGEFKTHKCENREDHKSIFDKLEHKQDKKGV